jgi:hypothetical protein
MDCECSSNKELRYRQELKKNLANFIFFSNLASCKNFGCYATVKITFFIELSFYRLKYTEHFDDQHFNLLEHNHPPPLQA